MLFTEEACIEAGYLQGGLLQGYHIFRSFKSIQKPVENPQNGNRFKTSPIGHFQIKKSIYSLQQVSLDSCLQKGEDYFKTEYREARETKQKVSCVKKYLCLIVILDKPFVKY